MASPSRSSSDASHTVSALLASSFSLSTSSCFSAGISYLCLKYDLTKEQVIRHYDVTGKLCPLYFVKHEDEWNQLKDKIEKNCQTISES